MTSVAVPHALTSWTGEQPPDGPVLVLLHGFGGDEQHLAGVGRALAGLGVSWTSLRAPQPQGEGFAWFPISTPGRPAPEGVEAAAVAVEAWVGEHLAPESQVVPIGFSQGGVVASHLLRTRFDRWQCAALLGSFVLAGKGADDARIRAAKAPVFSGRGLDDQVIAADAVARTDAWLAKNAEATVRSYKRLGHAVSSEEVLDLAHWVGGVLDPSTP